MADVPVGNDREDRTYVIGTLNLFRSLAALSVFGSHFRYLFFDDLSRLKHPSLFTKLTYTLSGPGHVGIMVFFVLSGYLVSRTVIRSFDAGRWSWADYATKRLTRLYVPLIPALLLAAALDALGAHLFKHGIYHNCAGYSAIFKQPVTATDRPLIWLGNLFFLQTVRVPVFGSDSQIWTLSNEFWYYVVFPFLFIGFRRQMPSGIRIACLTLGTAGLVFAGSQIALYFPIWLFGVALNYIPRTRIAQSSKCLWGAALVFVTVLATGRAHLLIPEFAHDLMTAVAFAFLMYFVVNRKARPLPRPIHRFAMATASISYSIYLLHVPMLVFLNGLLIDGRARWQPSPGRLAEGIVVIVATFVYIVAVWSVTEAKTAYFRDLVTKMTRRPSSPGPEQPGADGRILVPTAGD